MNFSLLVVRMDLAQRQRNKAFLVLPSERRTPPFPCLAQPKRNTSLPSSGRAYAATGNSRPSNIVPHTGMSFSVSGGTA